MATVKDIYRFIDTLAPFGIQEGFDNAGFLVGRASQTVERILTALDITLRVIEEAQAMGAQLIVAHHPVIFQPLKSVTDEDPTGARVLQLAHTGIAAICAHTNLDAVAEGVNDALARTLGLADLEQLAQAGEDGQGRPYGIGRVGVWKRRNLVYAPDFASFVKEQLNAPCVRYHDAGRAVSRVAVGGGSCGSMLMDAVAAGCDTFVTADVKHDVFLDAAELGINLLDAGHFATEAVVLEPLTQALQQAFPDLAVCQSTAHREVYRAV
ncbi:MAG: Nif3-like dinuclear metal center hexameric protein [Oscillospiraceae bacterium]|nr:Nif3-like dinuclear metal center hexameric protein [Oscillospiraceae bacterium]MBO5918847.1 Nif3-like dinuclear metal center hexameric protein [Oscillospiraceae bacterium]